VSKIVNLAQSYNMTGKEIAPRRSNMPIGRSKARGTNRGLAGFQPGLKWGVKGV
jgi:hypothetical protein